MKRFKSIIAAFVVALLSAALLLPVAACAGDADGDGNGGSTDNQVYVTSLGGMPLKNVTVELFDGSEGLGAKITDEEGKVTYDLDADTEYSATVSNVPHGYITESIYKINGADEKSYIRLNSEITDGTPTRSYVIGDVMYDFEQTYYTYDSSEKTKMKTITAKLSDFFEEGKKAVMIDFFYNTCYWCIEEYPYLKAAYQKYADKLEILAINDISESNPEETLSELQNTVVEDEVPYRMCKDRANVGVWFNGLKSGYPTAIMIDRYGILCDVYSGGQLDQSWWESWFEKYTRDNYSQDFNQGNAGGETFVPDKPDESALNIDTVSISNAINKTGRPVTFSSEASVSSNGWPWNLTEDKTAIYPTNSGHRSTMATVYAQIELNANEVLAFDYKLSTNANNDYFYVAVDARKGTGRQISMETGAQDWQTGYAYVALEKGSHEIAFTYYRSMANASIPLDDKVYINNLRIVSVGDMNAVLTARGETLEIPYFATREYNNSTKQFSVIDDVYVAEDGYYHIGKAENASASDPYLMLDVTHPTPYFGSSASSLYALITEGIIIEGVNYTNKFQSYLSFSNNSTYNGLIPVNEDIRDALTDLYDDGMKDAPSAYWSRNGWLQFCVSYRQYGVHHALTDPIKGLAYFSAFKATETTGIETYVKVEKGKGQFKFDEKTGKYVDVEGTSKSGEGEYDWNEGINAVNFERIIMPLGYMYEFTPAKSGAYRIQGVDCNYLSEVDSTSAIETEYTDATLYSGDIDASHIYSKPLAESGSDRFSRDGNDYSFNITYYLEANKTYYIAVNFRTVETTGEFAFRIDWLGEEASYIDKATAGFYNLDINNKMVLPLFVDRKFDASHTVDGEPVWYDKNTDGLIYLDFTHNSLLFNHYTIEQILDDNIKTAQLTFDISKEKFATVDGEGNPVEIDISLDLETKFGGKDKIPEAFKGLEIKDYTDIMRTYLEKSKEVGVDDEMYGLVPVNAELYNILQLFNVKFMGYDTGTEWLRACFYKVVVKGNN